MPRRYADLGPSRVRTRISSTRRLGECVEYGQELYHSGTGVLFMLEM